MKITIVNEAESTKIYQEVVLLFGALDNQLLECPLIEEDTFTLYIPAYNAVGSGSDSLISEEDIQSFEDRGIAYFDAHYVKGKTGVLTPDTYMFVIQHSGSVGKLLEAVKNLLVDMGITGINMNNKQDLEIDNMKVAGWAGTTCNSLVAELILVTFHADREFFEAVLPDLEFSRTATPGDPMRGFDGIEDIIGHPIDREKFIQDLILKLEES